MASLPDVGASIPRSGGALTRALGQGILASMGWRLEGSIPDEPRLVIIAAPHSTNWDFIVGIAAKWALRLRVLWLGKHSLFRPPLGIVMRALGGMPVDRSASHDVVGRVVAEFARHERLVVALAPEGTRKAVERWRTGFYHIAHGAGVPILPVALNWGDRAVQILPVFRTTGDLEADLPKIQALFAGVRGRSRA